MIENKKKIGKKNDFFFNKNTRDNYRMNNLPKIG